MSRDKDEYHQEAKQKSSQVQKHLVSTLYMSIKIHAFPKKVSYVYIGYVLSLLRLTVIFCHGFEVALHSRARNSTKAIWDFLKHQWKRDKICGMWEKWESKRFWVGKFQVPSSCEKCMMCWEKWVRIQYYIKEPIHDTRKPQYRKRHQPSSPSHDSHRSVYKKVCIFSWSRFIHSQDDTWLI